MSNLTVQLVTQDGIPHNAGMASVDLGETFAWKKRWLRVDALGLHVYARRLADGSRQLGVRFSNGCVLPDGTGFRGRYFYRSLTVTLDGVTIRLVPDGLNVMPPRAILERRFTIRNGVAIRGWDYDVPIPDPAPPFGPARELLPRVNRVHYADVFAGASLALDNAVALGTKLTYYAFGTNGPAPVIDIRTNALGPFLPDGYPEAGAPAGYGIDASVGWEQCHDALTFAGMAHECAMDRNAVACYHADTGEPITCMDWGNNYLAHPQSMKGEPAPQHDKNELPAFMVGTYDTFHYPNANAGSCPYQAALEAYQPDNAEHLIRAMRRAAMLVGWAQDPMAQDDLRMLFEHHRTMTFGDRADDKTHSTDGSYVPASLSSLAYYVGLNPGHGAAVLRSYGWIMMAGAWGKAPPHWSVRAIDTYLAMTDRFGIPQREAHTPYIPAGWKGTQGFHTAIIHIGAWTLSRAAGWRESDVLATIDRWRSYVLNARSMPLQERPDGPGSFGPPKWIFTQEPPGEVDHLFGENTSGGGFQEHVLAVLGRAAQSAHESLLPEAVAHTERFLTSGLGVDLPAARIGAKLAQMRAHTGDQNQYSAYWAMLEKTA